MAYFKRSQKSSGIKRYEDKNSGKEERRGPWAGYLVIKGEHVIFAKKTPDSATHAVVVDDRDEALALQKAIINGKTDFIFAKQYFHKEANVRGKKNKGFSVSATSPNRKQYSWEF
jgi:hypothetical protein